MDRRGSFAARNRVRGRLCGRTRASRMGTARGDSRVSMASIRRLGSARSRRVRPLRFTRLLRDRAPTRGRRPIHRGGSPGGLRSRRGGVRRSGARGAPPLEPIRARDRSRRGRRLRARLSPGPGGAACLGDALRTGPTPAPRGDPRSGLPDLLCRILVCVQASVSFGRASPFHSLQEPEPQPGRGSGARAAAGRKVPAAARRDVSCLPAFGRDPSDSPSLDRSEMSERSTVARHVRRELPRTPRALWVAGGVAVMRATGVLYAVSRGKWSDAIIDSGTEWVYADALARGEMLYRDVLYWFGPFTPYFQAAFFCLFGSSFSTLALCGLAGASGVLLALYFALRRVTARREAILWTALAIPALVFMPNSGGAILGMGYRIWHPAGFALAGCGLASLPGPCRNTLRCLGAGGLRGPGGP